MRNFFERVLNSGPKNESHHQPEAGTRRLAELLKYQARLYDTLYTRMYPTFVNNKKPYSDKRYNEKDLREWDEHRTDYSPYVASGSRSGNLYGFVRARGLVPTGELLQKTDIVPFSGELGGGISNNGINNTALSFSTDVEVALDYAHKYPKTWSLKRSEEHIRYIDESFKNSDDEVKKFFSDDNRTASHKKLKNIERKRQKIWHTLNTTEQSFISEPFPVIYGIVEQNTLAPQPEHGFKFIPGLSESQLQEHVWKGKLSADEFSKITQHGRLVVYVPERYIKKVADYFKDNAIDIAVRSIEVLTIANTQRTIEKKLHDVAERYVDSLLKQEAYTFYTAWEKSKNGEFHLFDLIPVLTTILISGDWRDENAATNYALAIWKKTGVIKDSLPEKQTTLLQNIVKQCCAQFADLS
jgi:hypothetical protein